MGKNIIEDKTLPTLNPPLPPNTPRKFKASFTHESRVKVLPCVREVLAIGGTEEGEKGGENPPRHVQGSTDSRWHGRLDPDPLSLDPSFGHGRGNYGQNLNRSPGGGENRVGLLQTEIRTAGEIIGKF